MTEAILLAILAVPLTGTIMLLRGARRDPDNWRIDLARMRPAFNHHKEMALIGLVLLFLAGGLTLLAWA